MVNRVLVSYFLIAHADRGNYEIYPNVRFCLRGDATPVAVATERRSLKASRRRAVVGAVGE
jgi:hypothetical protein